MAERREWEEATEDTAKHLVSSYKDALGSALTIWSFTVLPSSSMVRILKST
jgi:hypothetical protein